MISRYADIFTLVKADNGLEAVLLSIDSCSSFIILKILKDLVSSTVTRKFAKQWDLFGEPIDLITDNDSKFKNVIMNAYSNSRKLIIILLLHLPQANGKPESAIRTVKAIVLRQLAGCEKQWPLYLSQIQYYHNMKIKDRTGSSPFALMFARAKHTANDIIKNITCTQHR